MVKVIGMETLKVSDRRTTELDPGKMPKGKDTIQVFFGMSAETLGKQTVAYAKRMNASR